MMTAYGVEIDREMLSRRLSDLINQFYKILPIRESAEPSLQKYLLSLQREMLGCKSLITALHCDGRYLTLLSILQYLIENDCPIAVVRSEVFRAIGIIKKLDEKYSVFER